MSVDLPSVIAPPGEDGVHQVGPTSTRVLEPAIMSEFSISATEGGSIPTICDQYIGGDDIAVTLSGASCARRALGSFLYAGVSGTDPGRVLSWITRCVPDLCSISTYIITCICPGNVAGDSCVAH